MSEKETEKTVKSTEERVSSPETTEVKEVTTSNETKKKSPIKGYIGAVLIVSLIILGALYMMEKEGRSKTSIFESVIAGQEANAVVAVVNGTEIIKSELDVSISQFSQAAAAQGVDITSPQAITDIETQALEVLVNTELLKQAAAEKGISVTDEEVAERLEVIKSEIGGEDVLTERMEVLGITAERLQKDVEDEIIIQQLLEVVFEAAEIEVTDEEISKVYQTAGGEDAGLPSLEEVRGQIEEQVRTSKEQAAIDEYLAELKVGAEIDIE